MNKGLARALRRNMTDAERLLWYNLRDRRLNGYKFRRQYPIGSFIVDFVCVKRKLIVEVDGGQHNWNKDKDANRTEYLEEKGYRVLRFWNNEVLQKIESVLNVILSSLLDSPSP